MSHPAPRILLSATATLLLSCSLVGCSFGGPDEEAREVIDAIKEIGTVKLSSEDAIHDALDAYDSLNEEQKQQVDNYEVLVAAENEYNQLVADPVIETIDEMGEVSLKNSRSITLAWDAYSDLTNEQKELVTNADAIKEAWDKLSELEKEEEERQKVFEAGDTVKTSTWKIELTNMEISDTLSSSQSSTYWTPADGGTFLILEFDIECLDSSKSTIDDSALTDIVATYGTNTYSSWDMNYLAGQLWMPIFHTYFEANLPVHVYVYTTIPELAKNDNKPIKVDLTVAGKEKTITIR